MSRLHLKVGGLHCSFCARSIERAFLGTDGVDSVSVSLAHEEALVEYDEKVVDEGTIRDTLRDVGYSIRDPDRDRALRQEENELRMRGRQTLLGAGASALFTVGMLLMWLDIPLPGWSSPAAGVLAILVVFGIGRDVVSMALAGLRRRIFNQHVLLFCGALGALAGGLIGLLVVPGFPTFDFFGVAVFLMTYHLLSGWAAAKVRSRAQEAVRKLLDLRPDTARLVGDDGSEEVVAVGEVSSGARVRIRPGERIPLDGRVVRGHSAVDESVVTGEPMPRERTIGDEVIGGSLNHGGVLEVEVGATGEEDFLAMVARHVEEARALKPGVIQLVDRVLQYYVPAVLLVGIGAFFYWSLGAWLLLGGADWVRALHAVLTVYVMGYPCALGMATPLALMRGGGLAAERGILMRSAESFQVFRDVSVVVLDKTGTITEGEPRVTQVMATHPEADEDEERARRRVLRTAAVAELASEHPLAEAIVGWARELGLGVPAPDDFESATGRGVVARYEDREIVVGTPEFLAERGVSASGIEGELAELRSGGRTAVLVAAGGRVQGVIALSDRVKDGSRSAVARLRELGVETVMLTGDHESAARRVANEVGIERVLARVLPDQKAEEVGRLQAGGVRVAMVGDGINDAPALTRADVGVAIGAGTDIALESADVVLIRDDLGGVAAAFEVSRRSYRKTVQNLALAFTFNGVGVPVAATGLLHPAWAMAAMVASVSLVLVNSFAVRIGD